MNELIKIECKDGNEYVNGRDLHKALFVGRDFSTWIKERIEKYGFMEEIDFIKFDSPDLGNQTGRGGDRRSIEYMLSLSMAKELAMVENNEIGKEVRRYLIKVEQAWNTPELAMVRGLQAADVLVKKLKAQIIALTPKAEYYDTVTDTKGAYHMSEVAKLIEVPGIGRNNLFTFLREKNVLMENNQPYQHYVDSAHFRVIQNHFTNPKTGGIELRLTTLVYPKGVRLIRELLIKEGFFPRQIELCVEERKSG